MARPPTMPPAMAPEEEDLVEEGLVGVKEEEVDDVVEVEL